MIHLHRFGKWNDVLVFGYAGEAILLQGRRCKTCNAKSFRTVGTHSACFCMTEESLKKAGLWKQNED